MEIRAYLESSAGQEARFIPAILPGVTETPKLPPFVRQLFWVYYSFIALCLAGFCIITLAFAGTLAAGGSLARALCTFFALFWTLRLIAGTFVFDLRPYLTNRFRRVGYRALNIVFAYLPVVYALAAVQPRWLK